MHVLSSKLLAVLVGGDVGIAVLGFLVAVPVSVYVLKNVGLELGGVVGLETIPVSVYVLMKVGLVLGAFGGVVGLETMPVSVYVLMKVGLELGAAGFSQVELSSLTHGI
jgi:hypothetical protein